MKFLYQPKNSNLCGQTCVAMVCECSLDDAIEAVGKKGCTTGPDLANALGRLGWFSSPKMIRLSPTNKIYRKKINLNFLPKRCIAKVRSVGFSGSHWILIYDGKVYDPYPGRVPWEYISGYIEIYKDLKTNETA